MNEKQNDWAKITSMVEFVYINAKNASTGHIFFDFNYDCYINIFFKNKANLYSKSYLTD